MKLSLTKVLGLAAVVTFSAQSSAAMTSTKNPNPSHEVIEVIGKFSAPQLEKIAEQAKLDLFETFNTYNQVPEFKVVCAAKAEIGSNIKRQHCEPMYYKNEFNYLTQSGFLNHKIMLNKTPSQSQVLFAVQHKKEKADKYLLELAEKHPDLKANLVRYIKAKRAYEIKKEM